MASQLQHRVWEILESTSEKEDALRRFVQWFLIVIILMNVGGVVVGSVPAVQARWSRWLQAFETFSVIIFSIEYLLRLWSCPQGRLRYALTPLAIIDLIAIAPFYLPFLGVDFRFVRILRLARIFRLAKLARYSDAVNLFGRVFKSRREELALTISALLILIVVCSALMYYAENTAQPDKFTSIPTAMWWAVITVTTVGYGDVYPVTAIGRLIGSLTAILGILMIALPTSIFGAAFIDEISRGKKKCHCPHCGKEL